MHTTFGYLTGYCFENNCYVKLFDGVGNVVYESSFGLNSSWATDELVGFDFSFNFDATATEATNGKVVIYADNSSDLAEHERCYEIPVTLDVNNK